MILRKLFIHTLTFEIAAIRIFNTAFSPPRTPCDRKHYQSSKTSISHRKALLSKNEALGEDEFQGDINNSISKKLAQSLDIIPLLERVASYTGTKRGRDALLSLVDVGSDRPRQRRKLRNTSKRKAMMPSSQWNASFKNAANNNDGHRHNTYIVKISQSVAECRHEWNLIREATKILSQNRLGLSSLPPIYPKDSSPWDVNYQVDTDDDEWLIEASSTGWATPLQLEQVLQADQVIDRILKTHAWSNEENMVCEAPSISEICCEIDTKTLVKVHEEINGSVLILKGRSSYNDPSGNKSYSFKLNSSKFPALRILQQKEEEIMAEIDSILQKLVLSKQYRAKLSGNGEKREIDGRIVVTMKANENKCLGIPRGKSDFGSLIYVEPTEIVPLVDELSDIREEMAIVQDQIVKHFTSIIVQAAPQINKGLEVVARLDCIFARSLFGSVINGCIPHVGTEGGIIQVRHFVHPILTMKPVPIDLLISTKQNNTSLIISGPNSGGKTLAMKSFGMVAIMNRMAIPIPSMGRNNKDGENKNIRVDFFKNIFVKIGDDQNVMHGESTYVAQLNVLSKIVQKVSSPKSSNGNATTDYSLVLLDELGDGTDPEAGGCIAQAILEKLVENDRSRTVTTTHSNQLKALSLSDDRFTAASVFLGGGNSTMSKPPSYKLYYGTVGQSHALEAASRIITPKFPNDLILRAESLISSSSDGIHGEQIQKISEALQQERAETMEAKMQILECKNAMINVAKAYDQHLCRLEGRLDSMLETLNNDESKDAYDVIGESIMTLRLIKKIIKSREDFLKEKGLKIISDYAQLKGGESVIIVDGGDFDGETAIVSSDQGAAGHDELIVELHFDGMRSFYPPSPRESIKLKRKDIAIWDYPDEEDFWDSDGGFGTNTEFYGTVQDARSRLFEKINSLKTDKKWKSSSISKQETEKKFMSSRERKAESRKTKKARKKK